MTIPVVLVRSLWLPRTEIWLYNQVRYLPPQFTPHIVCEQTTNLDQFNLPNLFALSETNSFKRFWGTASNALSLRFHPFHLDEVIHRHGARLLHSHFGNTGWLNMKAARAAGIPHVVSFYGLDVNYLPHTRPVWKARYRNLFAHVAAVLCEGPHMADCLVHLGCRCEKIRIQRLGVTVEHIPFAPKAWRPGEPLRVLLAASFREKKGIPLALTALSRLARTVPVSVTLVGGPGSEPRAVPEHAAIMSVIERESMAGYVRLPGFLSHEALMEEARNHHIFLSPSLTASDGDTEGGAPVALLDMAASGLLLVSTRHCDIPQIVEHGVTGLLSDERDLDGLAENLAWLAAHPDRWATLRHNARRHVERKFDARTQAARLGNLYRELIS